MGKEQEEQEKQEGFRVTDKRGFQKDGESRSSDVSEKTVEKPAEEPVPDAGSEPLEENPEARPPIDFPSYILSYYTQGLVLLGEVPNPYSGKKEEDVEASKHTIEILSMLEEKTRGNLSQDEGKLLENVLYELRMKYMAKTNRIKI
ncbi:MAG: DUF1844 domain-containing protein [Acidobacteria bacterium]|nr:DUF1844 domain-containing protein [Acidobacteriota bacterium]